DTAGAKCSISIGDGLLRGILCNVLVCLAVWLAMSATDAAGKIIGTCLPVMLFVLCGYEHSVANMYFIPAGMLLSGDTGLVPGFLMNLIIVTLGNILGGAVIVGGGIYLLFVRPRRK
ncbi:MAG: formate/nitrite transporter family protein, partial [Lachnospiraceae bacterium]|nr:formate/nitrite transporter family protein [Lachnospiraceae bacterium]